jgi:hypothetical protein
MKKIFTPNVKIILIALFILSAIAVGIVYTYHLYMIGQFGQY